MVGGKRRVVVAERGIEPGGMEMNQERPIFEKTDVFWGGNGKAVSFVTQFSFPHSRSPLTLFS